MSLKLAIKKTLTHFHFTFCSAQIMPPVNEMMMFKLCEVFSESIPMAVIQLKNVLEVGGDVDWIVVGAFLVSIMFVAEAVSYMTYMKDISEESRSTGKIFYGFMPLSGHRMHVVKISLLCMSFSCCTAKSLEIVVLLQVGGPFLAAQVLGADLGIYLIYKFARNDFRYWIPLPRGTSLIASFALRVMVKIVTDFTGFLHARHPFEMGGFYWFINMIMTQVGVFGALMVKQEFGWREGEGEVVVLPEEERVLKDEDYLKLAVLNFALWLISMAGLYIASEKKFNHTFYSLVTGKQFCRKLFETDQAMTIMEIFNCHRR